MSEKGENVKKVDEVGTDLFLAPSVTLARAEHVSKELKQYLENNRSKLIQPIGSGEHIRFEGWQFLASRFGVVPDIAKVEYVPAEKDGRPEGFEVTARLIRFSTGEIIGSHATAGCYRDESKWAHKSLFELRGMAQTRACSRSCRQAFSWIVVMAGYDVTPFEEMTEEERAEIRRRDRQGGRPEPEKESPPVQKETPPPRAPGEATGARPAEPGAVKDEKDPRGEKQATESQLNLVRVLLQSHVVTPEERGTWEGEIALMNRFQVSNRIKTLKAEIEKRKASKSKEASAAFDDPGERPSALSVIENYLKANGQDAFVKGAGELRLKRIKEGEKASEASLEIGRASCRERV